MKRIFLKALLIACLSAGFYTYAQVQQHVWYLKNQEIDFSTSPPTASSIVPFSVCTGLGAGGFGGLGDGGNGLHDANGDKILSVYNFRVFSGSTCLGSLAHWEYGVNSPLIIPKPGTSCGYYIVYQTHNPFLDNPNDNFVPYCLPLTGSTSQYNNFYAEVDLSANFGAGTIVSNGNDVSACEHFNPTPIAASRELNNGNRFLYLAGIDYSATQIKKYLVSPAGITYANTVYAGNLANNVDAVELELSHDGTMLGLADNDGNKAFIFHLNATTGNLNPSVGNNNDGTSDFTIPTSLNQLTGVEFSPNGENMFVGSRNLGIYQIDLGSNSVGSAPLSGSAAYGNSQLELGYEPSGNHRIYAVSTTGSSGIEDLGTIVNPNSVSPTFVASYVTNVSAYDQGYSADNAFFGQLRQLPEQIDGEDYTSFFSNATGSCCTALEGFDEENYTVTASGNWSPGNNPFAGLTTVRIAKELRVPAGKNIHITDMVFKFNEGAKMVIEPGARVVLTRTTLTSMDCDGVMWKGVELQGNYLVDQTPFSQQGYLYMQANSEISNAHDGIVVFGRNGNGSTNWAQTGGIVRAYNSVFRNNIRDVAYLSYLFPNLGTFRNCEFITDAALKNGSLPNTRVSMYHVDGIGFYGCDFKNTTTGLYPATSRGRGITSVEAKYKVSYACTAILPYGVSCPDVSKDGNVFENLFLGIDATSANPFYTVDIRYNDFINNTRGAYLGGIDYAIFVNNTLDVAAPNSYAYGLYLSNCTGYQVENNAFSTAYPTSTYGALVINSNDGGASNDVNEIYHNSFSGFDYAGISALANVQMLGGNPIVNTGLTWKCNIFDASNRYDILNIFGGISPFQGACLTTAPGAPDAQANNLFSLPPPAVGHFWNANSTVFQMDYRFGDGGTMYQTEPLAGYYNLQNTTLSNCGIYDPLLSCPERRFDLSTGKLVANISEFRLSGLDMQGQVDGGSSSDLMATVNSNVSAADLRDDLLSKSPYLSDEVLIATIDRRLSLSNRQLRDVILANSPVSEAVMVALDNSELSNRVRDDINAGQTGVSAMQELRAGISHWFREAKLNTNQLIRHYLHDTIVIGGEDSVLLVLRQDDGLVNSARISSLLLKQQRYTEAEAVLNDLSPLNQGQYADFCEFQSAMLVLNQSSEKIYSLFGDRDSRDIVNFMATKEDGSKEWHAANVLLRAVFDEPFPDLIPVHSPNKVGESVASQVEPSHEQEMQIFPNPAKDFLTLKGDWEADETILVKVFDLQGQHILSGEISHEHEQMDVTALKNGIYLLQLRLPNGKILVKRQAILK